MRIAVVGAGGVGGGFGAALAKAGADVSFIARGAHLAAMKSAGLKVLSPRGDIHLVPTQATDNPAEIGPVDFVLFCVKLWDVESAGERIKPMIGPDTAVIPLQNGIDAAERLIPILGRERRDGRRGADLGLDHSSRRDQAGRHLHAHDLRRTRRQAQPARRGFSGAVPEGRLRGDAERAILTDLWMKFILLATNASIMALARQPIGKLRDDPDIRPVSSPPRRK